MKKHLLVVGIVFLFVGMGFQPAFANIIENKSLDPPHIPMITGPDSGKPGQELTYVFNTVHPEGDDVRFHIDWGDGNTEWTVYVESGTDKAVTHTWCKIGPYTITAYAQDEYLRNSDNETKQITISRNKQEDCDCQERGIIKDIICDKLLEILNWSDVWEEYWIQKWFETYRIRYLILLEFIFWFWVTITTLGSLIDCYWADPYQIPNI